MWAIIQIVLGALAASGRRWAYAAFVVMGVFSLPVRNGIRGTVRWCELTTTVIDAAAALGNLPHILLFGIFFIVSIAQVRSRGWHGYAFAFGATLVMGILLEVAQAVSASGNCEVRDLIPNMTGAVAAAALVVGWRALRDRPAPHRD